MKNNCLTAQFNYLFGSWQYRSRLWYKLYLGVQIYLLLKGYLGLQLALRRPPAVSRFPEQRCVVVLLSHNRYRNMDLIIRSALHNTFVSKLIVSNSNRHIRMADWVQVRDPRLVLIDETEPTQPGHRFVLADREAGDYFLSVDDDIFLTPAQWAAFFDCLVQTPEVPHGLTGNQYRPGTTSSNGSPFHQVTGVNQQTDALIGAFAFTRQHLARLFQLAETLAMPNLTLVRNGEDILLSFAGLGKPQIHDIGPIWACASNGLPGVALWQTHTDFWAERIRLFEAAQAARLAMPPPWATTGQNQSSPVQA
jgi:hypothetical protein